MKVCAQCGSEYREGVNVCVDCGGKSWVSSEEVERRQAEERQRAEALSHELDTHRFVRVDTAEDPFTAEQLVGALMQAHVTVYSRPRAAGAVDPLTTPVSAPWWDLLVPDTEVAKATEVLVRTRRELEATADDAARAAEEEATQSTP